MNAVERVMALANKLYDAAFLEGQRTAQSIFDMGPVRANTLAARAALRAAVESLAPKENQRVFAVNVLGTPMREYEPGKWEVARWPSLAAQAGEPEQPNTDTVHLVRGDAGAGMGRFGRFSVSPVHDFARLLLAHARQRVQPASEEQPKQPGTNVHLVRGDAGSPDGSEGLLPGFLFIAMDDDDCANLTFCADHADLFSAVATAMGYTDPPPSAGVEEVSDIVDELMEDGSYSFEGDPGFRLYKLHDGADVIAQAERQAFFLAQERDRALANRPAPIPSTAPAKDPRPDGIEPASAPAPDPSQRELLQECREALWICSEHNALHFGEAHNTVIQARAALAKLREHLKDDKAGGAGVQDDRNG